MKQARAPLDLEQPGDGGDSDNEFPAGTWCGPAQPGDCSVGREGSHEGPALLVHDDLGSAPAMKPQLDIWGSQLCPGQRVATELRMQPGRDETCHSGVTQSRMSVSKGTRW